ncbi:MAG: hypothetical protein PHZ04_02525 [Patescibacteria group bacterium]|nr:hypothetical protein [Patescibacteria group bacterium]MDD5294691.1 hypothetical protein [Patescibacteria group bacterium]MDD5554437.1 hypothetical protein [Patescibacteria group bacterium]
MKVFLIWAGKGPEIKNLMLELKKHGQEIVYWVGSPGGEKDKLPETIFHDHWQAIAGLPAEDINMAEFSPPGEDLIEKLYRAESIILTMMNKRYDKMGVDERRHLYYNMLQYWHGIIKKYKPELIIFPIIPHTVFNYLIYELARLLNIKVITFEDTWVSDRALLYTDFWQGSEALHKELRENQDKIFSLGDLDSDLQEYYKAQKDKDSDKAPPYTKKWRQQHTITNKFFRKMRIIIASLKDFSVFRKGLTYFLKIKSNPKREYASVEAEVDFAEKFIYLPLNYQPERTSSPQGSIFVDQILMIEILAASLPKDWVIYVKEHPTQIPARGLNFSSSRYQGYYKRISELKRVKLIPIETDTYTLINKSLAVATVTGTAGWEAVLRSKPAIIFGYPWYRDCPGVFKVNGVESCQKVLQKIKEGFKIEPQQIINYLYSFDKATIHGYVDTGISVNSKLNKQERMNNFAQAILKEIRKI